MSYVNKSLQKKDAMALVTGKPVYTDDLAPKDCLIIKILRSPYANAWVEEIKTDTAMKVEGMALILTWKDVPKRRFASAGQTYPEFSPYDRMILDQHLRFIGDAVAIVAGETEAAVDLAMKRIKVKYRVEPPVLDMHTARIIRFWFTRKKTGNPSSRLVQITSGTLQQKAMRKWEILTRFCQNANTQ